MNRQIVVIPTAILVSLLACKKQPEAGRQGLHKPDTAQAQGRESEILSTLESKVNQIIIGQLGVDAKDVTSAARFGEDLGADSLDMVELVMACEEEFDIEIPDEDAGKIVTVQDVYDYLGQRVK